VTFQIKATKGGNERFGYWWDVDFGDPGELTFSEIQYAAFRSLLMPSAKADFTITEVDQNGQTLR
jgi:hypothetical protein